MTIQNRIRRSQQADDSAALADERDEVLASIGTRLGEKSGRREMELGDSHMGFGTGILTGIGVAPGPWGDGGECPEFRRLCGSNACYWRGLSCPIPIAHCLKIEPNGR